MSNAPLVTVAVPVHNGARFLAACIDSVLSQHFQDWELLLIDDGSQDESPRIARRYADPRIRIETQAQMGQTATRNRATQLARGRYLAVLDQDDVCLPNRLAKQVAFLERHPEIAAVGASKVTVDDAGQTRGRDRKPLLSPEELAAQLLFKMCFVHPSMMFRREILEVHPHDERFVTANDYDVLVRIARHERLWNLPDHLLGYRKHESNLSVTARERALDEEHWIASEQLQVLGVDASPADLERHLALSRKGAPVDEDFLDWSRDWFERLCEANRKSHTYDSRALQRIADRRWLNICLRGARRTPAGAVARFARSRRAGPALLGRVQTSTYAARVRLGRSI